jgi:hypothetical protein
MPVFEVGLDDGRRLRIEADSQEAALAGVAHFQSQEGAKAPSGFAAGLVHGAQDWAHGNAETAKDFYGVGKGYEPTDKGYVPANVTNGSANPLNWNLSQIPQKIAEQAPGLGQDIVAASAASKLTPGGMKAKALAGLMGGVASAWHRTAGDTAKETAANRTGDANAEPQSEDLVKGGVTAAAAAVPGAIPATRFIPGANKVGTVGAQGALDSIKKYLATTAVGAGGAAGSDAITQAGTQLGTDKKFDPSRTLEAAAGGLVTAGALAAPRGVADTARAASLREFGGSNMDATKNYATRLRTAGDGELGNTIGGAKNDYVAHETVKSDLTNELRDAARNVRRDIPLGPDADNALQRAQNGEHLTPRDIELIDRSVNGAPDGDNAAFLARTLRIAQLAQERGSYNTRGEWAGGVSGVMDKNLGFLLNPVRLAGGTIATGLGMHLLGLSNPMFAGSVAAGYTGARALDSMAGTRSPAKMFADHFADHNAQLRMPQAPVASPSMPAAPLAMPWGPRPPMAGPTGPAVPAPAAPQAPVGPWGPKPAPTTSVPPVSPPAPPAAPAPTFNPLALSMLKQTMKQGLPPSPAPAAPEAPPAPSLNPMAVKMLQAKLKAGLPSAPVAENTPAIPAAPAENPASTAVPTDVLRAAKVLMSGRAKVDQMKAAAEAPGKITKSNGTVHSDDIYSNVGGYEPIPAERMQKAGMSHEQMAQLETDSYMHGRPKLARDKYFNSIMDTLAGRRDAVEAVKEQHPEYSHALNGLLSQLYELGSTRKRALQAIHHYAGLMSPEAGKALKHSFKPQLDRLWPQ